MFGFFNGIKTLFIKARDKVESITPPAWVEEFGLLGHTFASNLVHDFEEAAKAGVGNLKPLVMADLQQIEKFIGDEAVALAPEVLSGKLTLTDAVANGVTALKSDAVTTLVPALRVAGEATLTTILRSLGASAVAALGSSPTSSQANSSAAQSSAASKQ